MPEKRFFKARLEKSADFAPRYYQQALIYYDSAMIEWSNQNHRFIFLRNYGRVSELAKKSFECSLDAINAARKNISDTEENLASRLDKLDAKIKKFEEIFDSFPMTKKQRSETEKCKLLYLEGLHAYKSMNYNSCKSKLDSAELILNKVFIYFQRKLALYFQGFPVWQKQIKQTLDYSKKNKSYVIIVDKLARELLICKNGETEKRFTIELGENWIGDKQHKGDKTTPDGLYKIIEKKQKVQTRYYKALLLDYPNEEDKKRFALNKKWNYTTGSQDRQSH